MRSFVTHWRYTDEKDGRKKNQNLSHSEINAKIEVYLGY